MKNGRKIHRNFKLDPKLNGQLEREAEKTRRTQTAIVEMALALWFREKRGGAA